MSKIRVISAEKAQQENADHLYERSEDRISKLADTLQNQDIDWDSERVDDEDESRIVSAHKANCFHELDEILADAARKEAIEKAKGNR